jgi:DNA-directed RNA polymerase specialized sigma24 family protein
MGHRRNGSLQEAGKEYSSADRAEGCAERIEFLKQQCELLSGPDRVLMELILDGCTMRRLAHLLAVSESTLSRRAGRLVALLAGPGRKSGSGGVSSAELSILRMRRLEKLSLSQIACRMGLSIYRVRRILNRLGAMLGDEYLRFTMDD